MSRPDRMRVHIVQQGAWDMPLESMPLAAGYLTAMLNADPATAGRVGVEIRNFRGGARLLDMVQDLFRNDLPDIMAFSVLGWNYRRFIAIADTFRQMNPSGLVIFGGNHVSHQAERVLRECPAVDVIVNGEGELTFRDVIAQLVATPTAREFPMVRGVAYRLPDGSIRQTEDRERITSLDVIPSPFMSGAIPMYDSVGRFRYDVALMETNRGCPYKCSFCYWGGATGQRMRSFSRERIAEELDFLGRHQVHTVVLCDSNFGLLEADEQFVEDLIRVRERRGYPRALETSWAKNKSKRFYDIVTTLKRHAFRSSFTVALQSLSPEVLHDMRRKNMRVNDWESLVAWLDQEGLDCYAELVWGAPGETTTSFLDGYDRLSRRIPRIAIYPMLLLPNTDYVERRQLHGFVTVRGEDDDFEYIVANRTVSLPENIAMQRFIFWARIVGENQYLRHVLAPARDIAGISQSVLIQDLADAVETSTDEAVVRFRSSRPLIAESPAVASALRQLFSQPRLQRFVDDWWSHRIVPRFPPSWRDFATELFTYERLSRPVYVSPGGAPPAGWSLDNATDIYTSEPHRFRYDVTGVLENWTGVPDPPPPPRPTLVEFSGRAGFYENLDNHETATHYRSSARVISTRTDGTVIG